MARQMTLYEVDVEGIVTRERIDEGGILILRLRPGMSRAAQVSIRDDWQNVCAQRGIKVLAYEPDEVAVEHLPNPLRHFDEPRRRG